MSRSLFRSFEIGSTAICKYVTANTCFTSVCVHLLIGHSFGKRNGLQRIDFKHIFLIGLNSWLLVKPPCITTSQFYTQTSYLQKATSVQLALSWPHALEVLSRRH